MSIENHPNFFASKFIVDLMESFYNSFRGEMLNKKLTPAQSRLIKDKIIHFVGDISTTMDEFAEQNEDFPEVIDQK